MRQYAGYGSAEETNKRFHYLLSHGQTGLSVAFDLPTQMGYDSDHPAAAGEVGRVGVAICSLEDMENLLAGIPLDRVSTSMTINAPASLLLLMYELAAERQGVPADKLSGTIQNDILKEYAARGTYIYPPEPSMRLVTDTFKYCHERLPRWNPISISGYHIREAGATAVQEVAFTLANAREYCRRAVASGLDIDDIAPRLSFFFVADSDLFEEVAKFRAARKLWARLATGEFGARNPRSAQLRFHCQTSGAALTAQQPLNNVVRVAYQALAAVLGGAQSLHTNAYDEALSLPTEESARLALRTQQVLAHETSVAEVADPLGGSYLLEALTERIAADAKELMGRVDELGGAVKAIESGWVPSQIQESAYERQVALESGERKVVGVNVHQAGEEQPVETLRLDPEIDRRQRDRLRSLRASRDASAVETALARVRATASTDANLLPALREAIAALATTGEICDALRDVWGEHQPGY
jgi:methylmalonyl-CoA mutase N-terminal domain/subunit